MPILFALILNMDLRSPTIEKLSTRIPPKKVNPFDAETLEAVYDGKFLTEFLNKQKSTKTIRQVLILSKIGSAFDDLRYGSKLYL